MGRLPGAGPAHEGVRLTMPFYLRGRLGPFGYSHRLGKRAAAHRREARPVSPGWRFARRAAGWTALALVLLLAAPVVIASAAWIDVIYLVVLALWVIALVWAWKHRAPSP